MKKNGKALHEVEVVPISSLKPHPKNYRGHPDDQLAHLVESLKRFGVYRNVVVAKDGTILAGHGVVEAAKKSKLSEIPVIRLDVAPGSAQAIKVLVGDNEVTRLAEQDDERLAGLLRELSAKDELLGTGFDGDDVQKFIREVDGLEVEAPEPQFDNAKKLQRKWRTNHGQIWEVGRHRLMCGDSSSSSDVANLMSGAKAWMMATDPPYGVGYGVESGPDSARRFDAMSSDKNDGPELQKFLESVFQQAIAVLYSGAVWYLWHAQMTQGFFAAAAAAAQFRIHRQIIWVKSHFILGHGDFHWQHELCFYGWRKREKHRWFGGRSETTLWTIENPRVHKNHPTEKPPEIFARAMLLNTEQDEICFEPFSGSGSQLCAAEELNRICYAMEIEPKYVAVALERLSEMGLKPKLLRQRKSAA